MTEPARSSDSYVELIGEAAYHEEIEYFVANVSFEVRATKDEGALQQVEQLTRRGIERLVATGMSRDEIKEAGGVLQRPWWRRKEVGREATHRLRIQCDDHQRLLAALASLEGVASSTRESVSIHMDQPVFSTDGNAKGDALRMAIVDARRKAEAVANEARRTLGAIVRVEEGASAVRNSGFSGDEDWWGDRSRFGAGAVIMASVAEGGAPEEPPLSAPSRTIWARCRVRFQLVD